MTNQNMIISDSKSGVTMARPVAMPDSTLFPHNVQTALVSPHKYLRTRSFSKIQYIGNVAKINACIESMRDSSPTRRASDIKDQSSWINKKNRQLQLPSALARFEEIMGASKGKKVAVFLDYDGTLSPIVEDPDRAFMTNEMREAVRNVAEFFPTAIVSGRSRAKVYNFVKLSELYYAGSHGMDIKGPTKGGRTNHTVLCQPAREFLPVINELYITLVEKTKHIPGCKIENNKFCLSVHYRCVDEKKWNELGHRVRSVIKGYPQFVLTQGRKVLEIRPTIKWNKGNALEFLLESLGYADSNDVFPVYIGDDRTDEDAFKVLCKKGQGASILVSQAPRETSASYSLKEPLEVMKFLTSLVEWKRSAFAIY